MQKKISANCLRYLLLLLSTSTTTLIKTLSWYLCPIECSTIISIVIVVALLLLFSKALYCWRNFVGKIWKEASINLLSFWEVVDFSFAKSRSKQNKTWWTEVASSPKEVTASFSPVLLFWNSSVETIIYNFADWWTNEHNNTLFMFSISLYASEWIFTSKATLI